METTSFQDTPRYQAIRVLGAGGMGTVYEVVDLARRLHVALKVIHPSARLDLLRFKEEFRTAARLRHRNLVRLHDLVIEPERAFFTMELVRGIHLADALLLPATREARQTPPHATMPLSLEASLELEDLDPLLPGPQEGIRPGCDMACLESVMIQLLQTLAYLHRRGVAHLDLKPGNILVTAQGELKLLDFGLSQQQRLQHIHPEHIMGTPEYMAPEQILGQGVGPASDMYAVGTILFEMLTGRLPFEGSQVRLLHTKTTSSAPALPEALDIPTRWRALCHGLLTADPARRPTACQALELLGHSPTPRKSAPPAAPFVGRRRELARLKEVVGGCQRQPAMALIEGATGMGRSTLLMNLGHQLDRHRVFHWACPRHEQVTWSGLDWLLDRIAVELRRLPPSALGSLCAQLGPARKIFPSIGWACQDASDQGDFHTASAVHGLAAALRTLGGHLPVALLVDDLHWADEQSLALLEALALEMGPGIAVVGTLDPVALVTNQPAAAAIARIRERPEVERLTLGPLTGEEAHALLDQITPRNQPLKVALLDEEHSPQRLLLAARLGTAALDPQRLVGVALERLSTGARRLLEALSASRGVSTLELLAHTAGLGPEIFEQAEQELIEMGLIHALPSNQIFCGAATLCSTPELCSPTERFSHPVLGFVNPEVQTQVYLQMNLKQRQRIHRRIALALELQSTEINCTPTRLHRALHHHWCFSDQPTRARRYSPPPPISR